MLRKTVKGSYRHKLGIFPNELSAEDILRQCNTENIRQVVAQQQCKFITQVTRGEKNRITKRLFLMIIAGKKLDPL